MKNAAYYDVIHYKYNSDIMIVIMSYTINYVFYKQCRVGHSPHLAEGLPHLGFRVPLNSFKQVFFYFFCSIH